jgi:hypothetical protein
VSREIHRRYEDPLERVWLTCAERIGFRVERSAEVNASSDGRGTIRIGTAETLDSDDCLAQMILHELCHALVEGPESHALPDWGLDNLTDRDVPREHAALRLQAALATPHGLRHVLAPTTDFRSFYDALPWDPFVPALDPTSCAARIGAVRAEAKPWTPALHEALEATAAMAAAAAPVGTERAADGVGSIWEAVEPRSARHASGFFAARAGTAAGEATCGTCAWLHGTLAHASGSRCRKAPGARVTPSDGACERWEPALDCRGCAACCRGAYDSVTLGRREGLAARHPELVVRREGFIELRRLDDRCVALEGGPAGIANFTCSIYADRPRTCREFEPGGAHCLTARRRVGLSR